MGSLLETPITEKEHQPSTGNGLRACASGMQGWRREMEVCLRRAVGCTILARLYACFRVFTLAGCTYL